MPFLKTGCKITHLQAHMQTKRNKTSPFTILNICNLSKNIQISIFKTQKTHLLRHSFYLLQNINKQNISK